MSSFKKKAFTYATIVAVGGFVLSFITITHDDISLPLKS